MSDKSIKSTLHHGRKAETNEVENEIFDWILINRSYGIFVSSREITIKGCSLNNTLKFKNIKNLQKWCYKILKRHLLTFRTKTHFGQKLSDSYSEVNENFD